MLHAYTEDQLVEQPAIEFFAELGWAVAGPPTTAGGVGEPRDAGLLGRETKGEVVLVPRLRAALEKLNPTLPPEAIAAVISECVAISPLGETFYCGEICDCTISVFMPVSPHDENA